MLTVDTKTLLFTSLTNEEAAALQVELEAIVLEGTLNWNSPFLNAWCVAAGFDVEGHQKQLVAATAFPQRGLVSLVRHANNPLTWLTQ